MFWPVYETMLFRPIRQVPNTAADSERVRKCFGAKLSEVTFPSANGRLIHARYFALPEADRVFLMSEGKGGNIYRRLNIAEFLLQCGGSVLQYDYAGFGDSDGRPSLDGACEDAVAAYDYLVREKNFQPQDIVAYGESFGSGVTGQLVARREVEAVILHSGFTSLLRAARDTFPPLQIYPDFLFPSQKLDNVAVFSRPHPPLLIMHGGQDDTLSIENATDLYRLACEPKMLMTEIGAGHVSFSYSMRDGIVEFLRSKNRKQDN